MALKRIPGSEQAREQAHHTARGLCRGRTVLLLLMTQLMACAGTTGVETAQVAGVPIRVFLYRPAHCQPQALLFVFHG